MISMCWVNLPFGQNHPTYIKFVVSMSFAITSSKKNSIKIGSFTLLWPWGFNPRLEKNLAALRPESASGL
jgi:hypothetical protein